MRQLWLSNGDKVLCYTTETDGTIGSDALADTFQTEKELLEHCRGVNDKYLGMAHRKVTIFEVTLRLVKEVQIATERD